jgi:hypothetical protein
MATTEEPCFEQIRIAQRQVPEISGLDANDCQIKLAIPRVDF